ncbi:MAG: hypothetical protein H6978_08165 [Gammaproteobacteria bacterium]|nr:hypothetical protein [Gammaproteobacteria bacterium]
MTNELPIVDDATTAVSFRIRTTDLGFIKGLSQRFRGKQSDVLRFVVRLGLQQLAVLKDSQASGERLRPLLAEVGLDIVEHFEMNISELDRVINGGATPYSAIPREQLAMLVAACCGEGTCGAHRLSLDPKEGDARREVTSAIFAPDKSAQADTSGAAANPGVGSHVAG